MILAHSHFLQNIVFFFIGQVVLFIRKLKEILDGDKNLEGKYELVTISGEKNQIADVIVQRHHDADLQLDGGAEAK